MTHTFTKFHAHIYFSKDTELYAKELYHRLEVEFPSLPLGTFHVRTVGPHPSWMFTMSFNHQHYQQITLWLMGHLDGLSALVHPLSGDDLHDHTKYAMWFGRQLELDLDKL